MIEKLIDEPYWDKLETELSSFLKEEIKGLADIHKSGIVLSAYIFHKSIYPVEEEFFDDHNEVRYYLMRGHPGVPDEEVIKAIKNNFPDSVSTARKNLEHYFRSDYGVYCGKLRLLPQSTEEDYIAVKIKELKNENDIEKLFKEVKELTEYKIKNSNLYKSMNR